MDSQKARAIALKASADLSVLWQMPFSQTLAWADAFSEFILGGRINLKEPLPTSRSSSDEAQLPSGQEGDV